MRLTIGSQGGFGLRRQGLGLKTLRFPVALGLDASLLAAHHRTGILQKGRPPKGHNSLSMKLHGTARRKTRRCPQPVLKPKFYCTFGKRRIWKSRVAFEHSAVQNTMKPRRRSNFAEYAGILSQGHFVPERTNESLENHRLLQL